MYIGGVKGQPGPEEKIELSLEQRQVAIIAGAALVLLGVIFALGVLVGRQFASAALATPLQPPAGDLRALDAEKPPAPPAAAPAPSAAALVAASAASVAAASLPAQAHPAAAPSKPASAAAAHASDAPSAPEHAAAPSVEEIEAAASDDEVAVVAPPKPAVVVAAPRAAPAPKETFAPLPPLPEKLGRYTVQLGATQDRKDAQRLETRARVLGLKPYITAAHLGAKGTWYRIRAGAFEKREEAASFQKDVERELHCHSAVMPSNAN